MTRVSDEAKTEAIRLRTVDRLGLKEICRRTGIARSTASILLRAYPLTEDEKRDRMSSNAIEVNGKLVHRRYNPERSVWVELLNGKEVDRDQKGRIAEAAVLFRLALHGFQAWRAVSDGDSTDWLVTRPGATGHARLQVKWASRGEHGRPLIKPLRRHGKEYVLLTKADCDYVIGYDLETDAAFVVPVTDLVGVKRRFSCAPRYTEAWDLILL